MLSAAWALQATAAAVAEVLAAKRKDWRYWYSWSVSAAAVLPALFWSVYSPLAVRLTPV